MSDEPADAPDAAALARAVLETLVFAPIGLGAKLVEDTPDAVRRVRQELNNARFIGRLTVEQGTARLRDRAVDLDSGGSEADDATGEAPNGALAIAGYDELPAIDIVAMLEDLTADQRAAIAAHEETHRQRRTVLGKIAQLDQ